MHSFRHWLSFFTGVVIFILGLFPLIGRDEWLFGLMEHASGAVLAYLVAFGGLYLIIDSFFEYTFHTGVFLASFLVGLLVFGFGLVMILSRIGVISWSLPDFPIVVYHALFMLEGLFLMLASFVMD